MPELYKAVEDLTSQAKFDAAGKSTVAQKYSDKLSEAVVATAPDCMWMPWADCLAKFNDAFVEADANCQADCKPIDPQNPHPLSPDDVSAKKAVEGKFRAFVDALPKTVSTDTSFTNTPPTHFSFGTATAFVVTSFSSSRARVKIDNNGRIAADPLPRQITMLVVNWSPAGYDASSFRPLPREVSQVFFGAIIVPDFGVGAGWSRQFVRGLAFNAGGGFILSKGLRARDQIGQPPTDGTKPFDLAFTPVIFLGASVNFTGKS